MDNTFHVDIVTPERTVYSGNIISLVVPAELGYMGILANHAPLIAHLIKGKIILRSSLQETKVFNLPGSGFMEVLKNKVTLTLDSISN